MADIKNFLYAWCGKKKLTPNYDIRTAGNKNRQKFTCEVRVDGFNYTGMGNSTNKKDAQSNAARDFVNYLVRLGEMNAAEVPSVGVSFPAASDQPDGEGTGRDEFGNLPSGGPLPPHLVVKAEKEEENGLVPGVTGLGYSGRANASWGGRGGGAAGADWDRGANLKEYYARRDEQEAQATLESEEVDLNANLHGNWTLENAKARLNQFFQKEKTNAEYKYSQVGPDHNRSGSGDLEEFRLTGIQSDMFTLPERDRQGDVFRSLWSLLLLSAPLFSLLIFFNHLRKIDKMHLTASKNPKSTF